MDFRSAINAVKRFVSRETSKRRVRTIPSKHLCRCGAKARTGQRTCKDCHARYMRDVYRPKIAAKLAEARTPQH